MHRITSYSIRSRRLPGRSAIAVLCVAFFAVTWSAAALAVEPPVLLGTLATTETVLEEYAIWDIVPTPRLPQSGIDPYGNGAFETPALLDGWLTSYIPSDYDGYLIIEWREGVTEPLLAGGDHERFDSVVAGMVSVVDEIKRQRPAARVGFVGIPVFDYWSHGDAWRSALDAAKPLHDAVDAFFPDVRDVYGTEPERDHERLGVYVAATLEIAGDRPVFLYTSHRYENVTERWGYSLIPRDEYIAHISGLMAVEFDGNRPAGAVASGSERLTFISGASERVKGGFVRTDPEWQRVRDAFAAETLAGETVDDYLTRLHPYVLCLFGEAVRGDSCTLEPPRSE